MALTNNDLYAIRQIVEISIQTKVKPMIDEAVDTLALGTAAGFAEVHEKLAGHDRHFEHIDAHLEKIDAHLERVDADLNRIEDKLDATIDRVDDHAVRLGRLEPKAA